VLAIDYLNSGGKSQTLNAGGGNNGVSVLELVRYAAEVVGKEPVYEFGPRRAGDPAMLIADITKAKEVLGWSPKYTIKDTIAHAWNWENKFETSK
jgi:UDP-glucose 4-epimerase